MTCFEPLLSNLSNDFRLNADSIFGATGQKMTRYKIVDFPLHRTESAWVGSLYRMNRGMSLIILIAYLWLHKFAI